MHYFCTLFDSNYLNRGLALYQSLCQHSQDFHLFVVAFDELAYQILTDFNLPKLTVIELAEFEDPELLQIKPTRTRGEYCWTCTPSIIWYMLQKFELKACTYLDADLYFYQDPSCLIEEMGDNEILLTEHRYTPGYDMSATSGRFCVQFMTFKNAPNALAALQWWRQACINWCFNRFEAGKFGDQKYLDDWLERFDKVHNLRHLGGGVAPWNVQQYHFLSQLDSVQGVVNNGGQSFAVVFFHFHGLGLLDRQRADLGGYPLTQNTIQALYRPYLNTLAQVNLKLQGKLKDPFCDQFIKAPSWIQRLKRKLKGTDNLINLAKGLKHGAMV